jgi:putative phosphoribosyl transferase
MFLEEGNWRLLHEQAILQEVGMNKTNTENRYVQILSTGVHLEGIVSIPENANGLVIFVHGSGSSRHSPRNQYVAQTLQEGGLATLLFDLLTAQEEEIDLQTRHLRFDIDLLAKRTAGALEWLDLQPYAQGLKRGLFGSSTGAAAALMAAAELPTKVDAVVSRGGRPDLAGVALPKVQAPTLLIVGANDDVVIELNESALSQMQPGKDRKLMIVPGASHLFEEPGTLEYAARLAREWFQKHLSPVKVR